MIPTLAGLLSEFSEKSKSFWHSGVWVAQCNRHLTPDFGLGHDLRLLGSSPVMGSALSGESA